MADESQGATGGNVTGPTVVSGASTVGELTFGQKAVGITFNPSADPVVQDLKQKYADIIDVLNNARAAAGQGETGRLLSVAITEAQAAQVWAVKGVTWKD